MNGPVLVLGATGMLGHKMVQVVHDRLEEPWFTLRGTLDDEPWRRIPILKRERAIVRFDAEDLDACDGLLDRLRPTVVINCIGVIKQRDAAHEAIPSIAVNALLPHRLARKLSEWDARLIHFSTDCVFSGNTGGYTEDSVSDAHDLYGRTKFLGETASPNALTLRTSIIGRELQHGRSLLEWFLAQRGERIRGFTRAWWSGVTTNHLASLVVDIVERHPGLSGLYQVSSGRISKYDLLCRLRAAYDLNVDIEPDDDFFCDRSLTGDRLAAAIGYRCPSWDELLHELVMDPTPYHEWK